MAALPVGVRVIMVLLLARRNSASAAEPRRANPVSPGHTGKKERGFATVTFSASANEQLDFSTTIFGLLSRRRQ